MKDMTVLAAVACLLVATGGALATISAAVHHHGPAGHGVAFALFAGE